jgi:hypothetical protein
MLYVKHTRFAFAMDERGDDVAGKGFALECSKRAFSGF